MNIRRKSVKVKSAFQPNRVLIHKPTRIRLGIPEEVVIQAGLFIKVLVLMSKRLMRILINPPVLFQATPSSVFAVPQEIAVDVGHLFWNADLVAVEVVGLLAASAFFDCQIADLC